MAENTGPPVPDPLVGLGCGRERLDVDAFTEFARLAGEGQAVALVTVIGTAGSAPRGMGAAMTVREDGSIVGSVGGGSLELFAIEHAMNSLADGKARRLHYDFSGGPRQNLDKACTGKTDLFVQPSLPRPRLIIFGAGHIGSALAPMARACGFLVTVVDDRPGYPDNEQFPEGMRLVHGEVKSVADRLEICDSSFIVIVTHGHANDEAALAACLHRPWRYLGMIGSRAKVARLFSNLSTDAAARDALARVSAPIGLDLGGRSAGEIALAILAELQMVRYGKEEVRAMRGRIQGRKTTKGSENRRSESVDCK
ncbi:MAG: XdhC/CoxI family protein [Acidobacteriota bacterium]|nr:XdhC/CoxI family protein [Acidobacteriota bacterium]